jgi:molybdopterin molybdotransferase
MLELQDALARILSSTTPRSAEIVPLERADRRVLAQTIPAPISLPAFDNSAMDGYALRSADVQLATADKPVTLKCTDSIPAGRIVGGHHIQPGTCLRIFTGSSLPSGADAVVMQEDTRSEGHLIEIFEAVKPWENVRLTGEDIRQGTNAVNAGERITSARIALLSALGVQELFASKQPSIGILSTGNELVAAGTLDPGCVFESNRHGIGSLLSQAGGVVRTYPLVKDTLAETRAAVEIALNECDCIVTTGGVSVGEYDFIKAAFRALGGTIEFWKVSIKPGKPFVYGKWKDKFLFGLPGNPVSAFVTCLLLVYPAVLRLQGAVDVSLPRHPALLLEEIVNQGERCHFLRVKVDARGGVCSAGLQASHALHSLAQANALLPVPPKTRWFAGQIVQVLRWEL